MRVGEMTGMVVMAIGNVDRVGEEVGMVVEVGEGVVGLEVVEAGMEGGEVSQTCDYRWHSERGVWKIEQYSAFFLSFCGSYILGLKA